MKLEDLPEAFQAYEEGDIGGNHLLYLLFDLLTSHQVEQVLSNTPPSMVDMAVSEYEKFGDEVPLDEILIFSSGVGDHPQKAAIVNEIRQWLRRRTPLV